MVSPVSPVVTNICKKMFEDLASKTKLAPRIWRRYVDDTFCVTEEVNTSNFQDCLKSLHTSILFIMELEKDRYLHYTSHHPQHVKSGVTSCLLTHTRTVATGINA